MTDFPARTLRERETWIVDYHHLGRLWDLSTFSLRHCLSLRMHSSGSSGLWEHVEY